MRSEDRPKRVGSFMELKQVHGHTDDDDMVDPGSKFDPPTFEDDDEDLEETIAAAHHRFEDDIDTDSLLSLPPSPGRAERGMALSPQVSNGIMTHTCARVLWCMLIGALVFTVFIVGFATYTGTT